MSAVVWESVFWGVAAVLLYGAMLHLTWLALKPKPQPSNPDWFWGGDVNAGEWVPTKDAGLGHGYYAGAKPEQTDPPESKPTSGAG